MRSNINTPSRWSTSWRKHRPSSSSPCTIDLVAVEVGRLHGDELRPHDLDREPGHRQAAFLVRPLALGSRRPRVHKHLRSVALADVVHEEPLADADLRRRQPHSAARTSCRHRLDQGHEAPVDVDDVGRRVLQHRVTEQTDRIRRHPSIVVGAPNRQIRGGSAATRTPPQGRAASTATASANASSSRSVRAPTRAVGDVAVILLGSSAAAEASAAAASASSAPAPRRARRTAGGRTPRAVRAPTRSRAAARPGGVAHYDVVRIVGLEEHPAGAVVGREPCAARTTSHTACSAARYAGT